MNERTLEMLQCPFCGTSLTVVHNKALRIIRDQILEGVLGCECCAFPVIDGTPILLADDKTRTALRHLETGNRNDALQTVLNLDNTQMPSVLQLDSNQPSTTYRELLNVLCLDAEKDYFLYRFSDPTYFATESILSTLAHEMNPTGLALDLCGGSGHVTRTLLNTKSFKNVVVTDVHFWKLFLATRIVAPDAIAVCCDANSPLPFPTKIFSTILLSDAFPYIWHKRLLAGEMERVMSEDGLIVMPHLHSTNGYNYSAGNTLSPSAYQSLFRSLTPRLFNDETIVNNLISTKTIDFSCDATSDELNTASSLALLATRNSHFFRRFSLYEEWNVTGVLRTNPLYEVDYKNGQSTLTLRFPTEDYENEFGESKRYLPTTLSVSGDLRSPLLPAQFGSQYSELRHRRVLLDLPLRYC